MGQMLAGWYLTVHSEKSPRMCGAEHGISSVTAERMISHLGSAAGMQGSGVALQGVVKPCGNSAQAGITLHHLMQMHKTQNCLQVETCHWFV